MAAHRIQSGAPETASGVALAVAPAGLRRPGSLVRTAPAPPAAAVPRLTGLADPLDVAAACLDDAVEVPERRPGAPRVPVHV